MSESMFGGGYGMHPSMSALFLQNPEAAKALRKQQFAQYLLGRSKPEDIKSPAQGLNHLATSALSAFLMAKGDQGFDEAAQKQADEAKQSSEIYRQLLNPGGGQQPMQGQGMPILAGNVPPGIHQAESGGSMQPGIYGDGGRAAGPMQVHPQALFDVNQRLGTNYTHPQLAAEPQVGKLVGDTYYKMMLEQFGGDDQKARAAYNAGPGRVAAAVAQYGDNWLQGIPDATKGYLQRTAPAGGGLPAAPTEGGQMPPGGPWDAKEQQAQNLLQYAAIERQSNNQARHQNAAAAERRAEMMLRQAESERNASIARVGRQEDRAAARADAQANRVFPDVTRRDDDGVNRIYARLPDGSLRLIGDAPKENNLTETQGRVGGYASRMFRALPIVEANLEAGLNRTQDILGKVPLIGNSLVSEKKQVFEQAAADFVTAHLRRDSGATIQDPEAQRAYKQFIPMPGDGEKVLAQKKAARQAEFENLAREAGRGFQPTGAQPTETKPPTGGVLKFNPATGKIE